jgi:hypothetical protein
MTRTVPARLPLRLAMAALWAMLVLTLSPLSRADGLVPLPPVDGVKSPLQVRVVGYRGGTNGEMLVEVTNPTKKSATFVATGLYFVPAGDPEQAPQRLGATGPFRAPARGGNKLMERLEVAAGATTELRLEVFCIDSHRASPTPEHQFGLANKRLPKTLRTEIEQKTQATLRRHKGKLPAPAKMAIQTDVWSARDRKWIALDGERSVEKTPTPSGGGTSPRHPQPKQRLPAAQVVY